MAFCPAQLVSGGLGSTGHRLRADINVISPGRRADVPGHLPVFA